MNELINQQRDEIARLEKILQRYETQQLEPWRQRTRDAEQRVKELEKERDDYNQVAGIALDAIGYPLKKRWPFNKGEYENHLNKFAIEAQIKAFEWAIQENSFNNEDINAEVIYVDDLRVDIEQLRAKLGGEL